MDTIPSGFKFPHLLIFAFLLMLPFFLYQIINHMVSTNKSQPKNKLQVLKYSCMTKNFLSISLFLSYTYVITTSFQSILMWINSNLSASVLCPFLASCRMISYVSGRSLLYCYFIYRTSDIFKGTYLEFSNCAKHSLTIYIMSAIISISGPAVYVYSSQSWTMITDTTGNGTYCKSDDYLSDYISYIFVWGSLNDITYSVITIFMMVSRLFLLLTDNERKKSRGKRYEFNSSKDSNRDIVAAAEQVMYF